MSFLADTNNPTNTWSGDPKQNVRNRTFTVQTTNGTLLVAESFTLATHAATELDVVVMAFDDTNGDAAVFVLTGAWLQQAGSPTVISAPTVVRTAATTGAASWVAALALNTNAVEVRVTGAGGKTIRWGIVRQYQEVLA